jgi:hypothetical protein
MHDVVKLNYLFGHCLVKRFNTSQAVANLPLPAA